MSDPLERALLERIVVALERLADTKRTPVFINLEGKMTRADFERFREQWQETFGHD